jgi:hypothetical protein
MNSEVKLKLLQQVYVQVLAEAVFNFKQAGILEEVRKEKRKKALASGEKKVTQFDISEPEEVFQFTSQLFNCAHWETEKTEAGFLAEAEECQLCKLAKKSGAGMPCYLYCLDPMEGMIKGLDSNFEFEVLETLWGGEACRIKVTKG